MLLGAVLVPFVRAGRGGFAVYGVIRATIGLRLGEEEHDGADPATHPIPATPRRNHFGP